jgi:hypothetical protein
MLVARPKMIIIEAGVPDETRVLAELPVGRPRCRYLLCRDGLMPGGRQTS